LNMDPPFEISIDINKSIKHKTCQFYHLVWFLGIKKPRKSLSA
jgi:hypothetical protein